MGHVIPESTLSPRLRIALGKDYAVRKDLWHIAFHSPPPQIRLERKFVLLQQMCVHYTLTETLPRLADQHLLKSSVKKVFWREFCIYKYMFLKVLFGKKNLTLFTLLSLHSIYWNVLTDDSMWPAEGSIMLSYKRPAYPLSRWWAGTINNPVKYLRSPLAALASQPSFSLYRWGRIRSFIEFYQTVWPDCPPHAVIFAEGGRTEAPGTFVVAQTEYRVGQHKNTMTISF